MADYRIIEDDLTGAAVLGLLAFHLGEMHALSPPSNVHAMPVERLRQSDVTFFSAWSGEDLAAVGALREIAAERAEIKSMRAAPAYRGQGAGEAILLHLMKVAQGRGYSWLGLETAWPEPWRAARALYRKHSFVQCEDFGDYRGGEFSLCMSLAV
ncbi:MAG: GNAT family N-acetyltransferase [Croceibacterium sp.]